MNKELVEKMQNAIVEHNHAFVLDVQEEICEKCAAVASEHYGDKWTRVEDGLPENRTWVMGHNGQGYELVLFKHGLFYLNANDRAYDIIFWQPLPQPPQQ